MNLQSQCRGDKIAHRWRMMIHADGCHFFSSSYSCRDCGAAFNITCERTPNDDPWSSLWMMDEDGGPICERCEELLDGAEPKEDFTYYPAAA